MTNYLTIEADDARAVCARLEFDASWDKAGPGYYELNKQIKASLSVGVGGFVPYSYDSILAAMAARLIDEDEEGPATFATTAIERRNALLAEVATASKNRETLARLVASNPQLMEGGIQHPSGDWDVETMLRGKVISAISDALNTVIVSHLLRVNKDVHPAAEFAKTVEELIENRLYHRKKQGYLLDKTDCERLKRQLQNLVKGMHKEFVKGEVWKFVSSEAQNRNYLPRYYVAVDVLALEDALNVARKVLEEQANHQ